MNVIQKYFSQEGQLLAEGRVLYAEAIHLSKVDELPLIIQRQVAADTNLWLEILELYDLIDCAEIAMPHPFFSPTPIHNENCY